MNLNGTSDLRRAELEDLVKCANGDDAKLASDAKFEITLRQLKAIQTGATLGRAESLVKSGRPDPRAAMARALRSHAASAPIVKAGKKGDLSSASVTDLRAMVINGSTSEATAAKQELGNRFMLGTLNDEPDPAPAPVAAPSPAAAAPVTKSGRAGRQDKPYRDYLAAAERADVARQRTGSIPAANRAELQAAKRRAGL